MIRVGRTQRKSDVELQLERIKRNLNLILELRDGVPVPADFFRKKDEIIIGFEHPMSFLWDIEDASEPFLDSIRTFYIEIWATRELALRDATIKTKQPDQWLNSHPDLLLAFDAGNSIKHPDKKIPPRSGGTVDVHLSVSALSAVGADGLRRAQFAHSIIHNGVNRNGYDLASAAVSEWEQFLV